MTRPAVGADPLTHGGEHVRALVDDVVAQVRNHLTSKGATNAARLLDDAPIAVSTRGWLAGLFAATHPDLVSLPRLRLDEVGEARYVIGRTLDDEALEVSMVPDGDDRLCLTLHPAGRPEEDLPLYSDAEGARVVFLAGLAVALHQHSAFRSPGQATDTPEPSNEEVTDSER